MTREELLKKIDFEKSWLYDCGVFGADVDTAFHAIKNKVIEAFEQEDVLDKIKADLEKLANDDWNTKVGSVSQGLECAIEIIEAYQEGR